MSDLHQVILSLIERVENGQAADGNRLSKSVTIPNDFCSIDWLEAQPLFPKFYWQSRDGREEVVALEQLHAFTDPSAAYTILGDNQRVWGGKAFDNEQSKTQRQSCYFFLPIVELIRQDDNWSLNINLSSDVQRTLQVLHHLKTQYSPIPPLQPQVGNIHYSPQFNEWQHIVNKALSAIDNDQFEKVVLARKTNVELPAPIRATHLLKASRAINHNSFHFLLSFSEHHGFMGSTPERLYSRIGESLATEAVAGTIGRSDDAQEDARLSQWLLSDDKNLRENQIVVDDIVQCLAPYTSNIDVQPDAALIQLRKVQHLIRPIHANLSSNVKGVQLLSALQPTAAMAGLPRDDAIQFIRTNEPFTRGWYSGSVGYFGHDKAEFCVAIRSALINDNTVKLYAGAGIVPGSEAQYEWQELNRKTATLLSLISDHNDNEELA
ncbi:isochorismate synthase [Vibrio algicola]|uniref:Isochorismate synthase MenF n=1 Tax=Vibrio algicola TaxID=2662262 RepID=A0A5Q0TDQ4_9VIBR|nr:isochorismate synthase [Vibrio algicola]